MTQPGCGTFGPGGSMLHGLDNAVKLIAYIVLCTAVLFTGTWVGHALNLIFCFSLVYIARMNTKDALRSLNRVKWPLFFILLLNFLFAAPEKAFFRTAFLYPSREGLSEGFMIVLRIGVILVFSDVLGGISSSLKINEAIRSLIRPLKRIGLPADRLALMLGLVLRFVPTLFEEAEKIRSAQNARGIAFKKNSFFDIARAATPIAVPLVVSAFHRAGELSLAMEARGCRLDGKGPVTAKIRPGAGDWAALFVSFAFLALHIIVL